MDTLDSSEDKNNYLTLHQEDAVLDLALDYCIRLLSRGGGLQITDEATLDGLLQLGVLVADQLSETTENTSRNVKKLEESTVECLYCGIVCPTTQWRDHVIQYCSRDLTIEYYMYWIRSTGIECQICKKTCLTFEEKEYHEFTFEHTSRIGTPAVAMNHNSIFCTKCEEVMPNNDFHCFGHIQSTRHKGMQRTLNDWLQLGVRYIIGGEDVRCLTCHEEFDLDSAQTHQNQKHPDNEQFGILGSFSYQGTWCIDCNDIGDLMTYADHLEICGNSIKNWYCQQCFKTIEGVPQFLKHLLTCPQVVSSIIIDRGMLLCEEFCNEGTECFSCGQACFSRDLRTHLLVECPNPFDSVVRTKKARYKLTQNGLECNICPEEVLKATKDYHYTSIEHKNNKDVQNSDSRFIFCTDCQETLPNFAMSLDVHCSTSRHTNLFNRDRTKVKLLRFNFGDHCFYCLKSEDIYSCTHCNEFTNSTESYMEHCKECNKELQNYFCQLCCETIIGRSSFVEHLNTCAFSEDTKTFYEIIDLVISQGDEPFNAFPTQGKNPEIEETLKLACVVS